MKTNFKSNSSEETNFHNNVILDLGESNIFEEDFEF
jgi:hypothetical protein